ncbi:MAG: NAD(P)H-binding protein [Vicinamibacterales bacterium]|nr:NAD(P)H-binding protein [Vicinamibacterales bacterium]
MRIFLTGATGYIGSAVLDALLRAGHQVTAIARDPEKAERLTAKSVTAIVGELGTPKSYLAALEASDAVVSTAFEYSARGVSLDRQVLEAVLPVMAEAAKKQPRTFIYTSGIWVLGKTSTPADEEAPLAPAELVAWRPDHEQLVLGWGGSGLRTIVVRPGIVYGGGRGIVSDLIKDALNGLVRVIGPGRNHWPCIYDRDLADLYARLVANPEARGIFHANDEGDERVNDIVEAIAAQVSQTPDIRHMPMAEARKKLGPYADALALDQKVRSPRARALGWAPTLRSVAGNVARLLEEYRGAQRR